MNYNICYVMNGSVFPILIEKQSKKLSLIANQECLNIFPQFQSIKYEKAAIKCR